MQKMYTVGSVLDGRKCIMDTLHQRRGHGLFVTTGWPAFAPWSKQNLLKEILMDNSDSTEVLKEIHQMFGGKLFVDGILCFANYRQVAKSVQVDPRNGNIRLYPNCHQSRGRSVRN